MHMSDIVPNLPTGPKKAELNAVKGDLAGLSALTGNAESAEFNEWRDKARANRMFEYFASSGSTKITREDLHEYLRCYVLEPGVETEVMHALEDEKNGGLSDAARAEAEKKINTLIKYLTDRSEAIRDARAKLKNFASNENLPPLTGGTLNAAKKTIGTITEGFWNASTQDKALMVVGVAAMLIAARAALSFMDRGEFRKGIKNTTGVILGVGVTGLLLGIGYEAAWKATKKTDGLATGSRLPNLWIPEDKATIDRLYSDLSASSIPMDFLGDVETDTDEQKKYVYAMSNMTGMTAEDFQSMISEHMGSGSIDDASMKYRRSPFSKDGLTPVERWKLAREMGESLGLIHERGGSLQCVSLTPAQKKLTLLYWSMERYEEMQKYN